MPKATSKDSKDPGNTPASFETALAELEAIVQGMEQGSASLEASLAAYERGTMLLRYCQDALANAEQKIRILEEQTLKDFEERGDGDA